MKWYESLYFGTWQLSEDFRLVTENEAKRVINFALKQGINNFDTAHVYGNGNVEFLLGDILPETTKIITKIPATQKPMLDESSDIGKYYPINWMSEKFETSMVRLKRERVYGILLHNWSNSWKNNYSEQLSYLLELKSKGSVEKIGISIPNNFVGDLPVELVKKIDIIEAPYNYENNWVSEKISFLYDNGIEIILRSIFLQGKHRKLFENTANPETIIKETPLEKCRLVIGMTKEKHILNNIQILKEIENHEN